MWIQIDEQKGADLLAMESKDSIVQYFQERVRHYKGLDSKVDAAFREAAQDSSSEGDWEVDEDAVVSRGSDAGAYVMSWTWVTNHDAGIDSEEGSEDLTEADLPKPTDLCECGHPRSEHTFNRYGGFCNARTSGKRCRCEGYEKVDSPDPVEEEEDDE